MPLDDVGRREAWEAARSLAGAGLSAVYTSSLGRAREVARAICSTAGVDGSDDLSGLINLDYGKWHGLTKQEAAERHPEEWWLYRQAPELATCPGGEPLARAADRVTHELLEIARRHPGEAVAAVTHGVMVRLAALRSHGRFGGDVELGDWQIPLPTGSATIFEVSGGKLSLVHVPEVVHGAAIPTGHALGRRPAVTRAAVS